MQKNIFFGFLISLNILNGSIFSSQAKVHVRSDAIHDMAAFEMLEKIKTHVATLCKARVLQGGKNNHYDCRSNTWPKEKDWTGREVYLELNEDNFDSHGKITWQVDLRYFTIQGFLLNVCKISRIVRRSLLFKNE